MREIVKVAGGLANKMFHCAFAISLRSLGCDVMIDTKSQKAEFSHDVLSLRRIFPYLDLAEYEGREYKYAADDSMIGKIMRRIPILTGKHYYISHCHGFDDAFINRIKENGYVIGYFQNELYFKNCEDEVRKVFEFADIEGENNLQLLDDLKKQNSVCLHVRKGDGYSNWPEFAGTCPVEYYRKAVDCLEKSDSQLYYYVFTDSPEWVKQNFGWLDYKLVDWNPCVGWGNHFDMQLMSNSKHCIIANSTYSWWAAWLNRYSKKIIVAPRIWFNLNSSKKIQPDIIPSGWVLI